MAGCRPGVVWWCSAVEGFVVAVAAVVVVVVVVMVKKKEKDGQETNSLCHQKIPAELQAEWLLIEGEKWRPACRRHGPAGIRLPGRQRHSGGFEFLLTVQVHRPTGPFSLARDCFILRNMVKTPLGTRLPPSRFVKSAGFPTSTSKINALLMRIAGVEVVHGRVGLGTEVSRFLAPIPTMSALGDLPCPHQMRHLPKPLLQIIRASRMSPFAPLSPPLTSPRPSSFASPMPPPAKSTLSSTSPRTTQHAPPPPLPFPQANSRPKKNRLKILHGGTIASMVDLGGSLAVASMGLYATGVTTDMNSALHILSHPTRRVRLADTTCSSHVPQQRRQDRRDNPGECRL